jgi:hypothetical protein
VFVCASVFACVRACVRARARARVCVCTEFKRFKFTEIFQTDKVILLEKEQNLIIVMIANKNILCNFSSKGL